MWNWVSPSTIVKVKNLSKTIWQNSFEHYVSRLKKQNKKQTNPKQNNNNNNNNTIIFYENQINNKCFLVKKFKIKDSIINSL